MSSPQPEMLLREWEAALASARHTDWLLIRLRAFALPVVVIGVAFLASADLTSQWAQVAVEWYIAAFSVATTAFIGILVVMLALVLRDQESDAPGSATARPHAVEWLIYALLAGALLACEAAWWVRALFHGLEEANLPIAVLLVTFGTALASGLYLLDRYYYFRLLAGVLARAETLEDGLGFRLTASASGVSPRAPARVIVTLLYGLPVLAGLLVLVVFSVVAGGN
jgi:hypothetical protein